MLKICTKHRLYHNMVLAWHYWFLITFNYSDGERQVKRLEKYQETNLKFYLNNSYY